MLYRSMPNQTEKLSILGYGCMRFHTDSLGKINVENAKRQVRMAIDNGVNYLDTAYPYHRGESESFLGKHVLTDGYREKVYIATKLPVYLVKKTSDMKKFFNRQLKRLNTEYIDYYLLHAIDGPTWRNMKELGIVDFLNEIKRNKQATYVGFSYHGTREDFNKIVDEYPWDFCQIQYNYLDEYFQAGIDGLNYAAKKGLGIIVMEPLRGGQLVGKIPNEVQKIWDSSKEPKTPAEWALRFIWNNEAVQVVLSGMSEDEHIEENIRIASDAEANSLTEDELRIINMAKDKYHDLLKINCTGCRYCMPCPVGIDIPYAFQTYNEQHMFGSRFSRKIMYTRIVAMTEKKEKWTSKCINCGKCEKLCPQKIEIRKEFKNVQRDLEKPIFKAIAKVGKLFIK